MPQLVAYLRLRRTRAILGCFLLVSVIFVAWPNIDLGVSALFFHDGFLMAASGWTRLLQGSVTGFIVVSTACVLGLACFNRYSGRSVCGIDSRKAAYLLLVLVLGAGLAVNAILKDNSGRARPRDVQQFGGAEQFTRAFAPSHECARNCSFPSGDSAGAFYSLAFAFVSTRRRAIAAAAIAFGAVVSATRIAAGAHFLSDTLVSFFIMLVVADALHYWLFAAGREVAAPQPALRPAVLASVAEKRSA